MGGCLSIKLNFSRDLMGQIQLGPKEPFGFPAILGYRFHNLVVIWAGTLEMGLKSLHPNLSQPESSGRMSCMCFTPRMVSVGPIRV